MSNFEKLPETCFSVCEYTGKLTVIKRGENGYHNSVLDTGDVEKNRKVAIQKNLQHGVSGAQRYAMEAGSIFGWGVPAADPDEYKKFFIEHGKENRIDGLIAQCDDMAADSVLLVPCFGKDGNMDLYINKDPEFNPGTKDFNIVTIHTIKDGVVIDDTEDTHVTDGSLERELERIWEGKNLSTI